MKDNNYKRRKIIKISIIVWVILSIVFIVYAIILNASRIGKTATVIKCAPYTAKAYLDKKSINNNTTEYIADGEHEFTCFLPDFQIYTKRVTIDNSHNSILAELLPVTSTGKRIQQELINDYYNLESYAGKISQPSNNYGNDESDRALLKFLPYNNDNFGLGMFTEDNHTVVTATIWKPGYTQMALDKLIDLAKTANISLATYDFKINDWDSQLPKIQDGAADSLESFILNGYQSYGLDIEINSTGEVGNYYWALISVGQPSGGRVIYRALLENTEGMFKMLSEPYPILNQINTPNIETSILDAVNNQEMLLQGNT